MAAVSLSFALVTALKAPIAVAVIFGLLWGTAIMSLDRLFVASMHRYENRLLYLLMAAPRFVMAVLLGFVISTPFVLVIFRPEITHQIKLLHAADRSAYYKNLPHNPVYQTVQEDQASLTRLTDQAATGGAAIVPARDPTIAGWETQLTSAQNHEQTWFANLQCQLYGTKLPGGRKCVQGNGPLAHDDQQQWIFWKGQVSKLQGEIQNRTDLLKGQSAAQQKANRGQARTQVTAAKKALTSAQQQLTLQTNGITGGINQDNGLLTQLKGLGQATAGDSTLGWARLLLFLVFLIIDIMPVFIKLLLNLAPASTYDLILAQEEGMEKRSAENDRAARQAILRKAAQAEVSGARDRLAALSAELPGIREEIIAVRLSAEREWLERFRADQRRRVTSGQGITPADTGVGWMPTSESWQRYAPRGSRRWPPRDNPTRTGPPPSRFRIRDFLRWPDSRYGPGTRTVGRSGAASRSGAAGQAGTGSRRRGLLGFVRGVRVRGLFDNGRGPRQPDPRQPDPRQLRRPAGPQWRPWPVTPPLNPPADGNDPNAGPPDDWTPPPDAAARPDAASQFAAPDNGEASPAVPPAPDPDADLLSPPGWVNGNGTGIQGGT